MGWLCPRYANMTCMQVNPMYLLSLVFLVMVALDCYFSCIPRTALHLFFVDESESTPRVFKHPQGKKVLLGENVTLRCVVSSKNYSIKVNWTKNGRPLKRAHSKMHTQVMLSSRSGHLCPRLQVIKLTLNFAQHREVSRVLTIY